MIRKFLREVMVGILILLFFTTPNSINSIESSIKNNTKMDPENIAIDLYRPINNDSLNIMEDMVLSPMFTPDNALDIHSAWLSKANSTIVLQNQYIKPFDNPTDWSTDSNPIVREIVKAAGRGVDVRVQVREDSDDDNIATYLNGISNIEVKYMGSQNSSIDDNWLSITHNKMILIDNRVSLISSINYGENAFSNNREAGMVIQSTTVTAYYQTFFEEDWEDGEIPLPSLSTTNSLRKEVQSISPNFVSHTNIPKQNFSGVYNVSAFVNPDNADKIIFEYLKSAKKSIYVSMYTISRQDFVDVLVDLKKNNPSIDIQVLISRDRVSPIEDLDTITAAQELVANLIPVYNSTDGLRFYHNKYWIIDGKHTFIYSGNWSPRSTTAPENDGTFTSGDPNRDMGIAVHDAPDIANFIKTEVWEKDIAVGSAWDLPVGIKQTSFENTDVVSGEITLSAVVNGLLNSTVSYRLGSSAFREVNLSGNSFKIKIDTTVMNNGITEFEVKAQSESQTFSDLVKINIVNLVPTDNWRFLITEIHPNPSSDIGTDSEAEFFEITNSFPFDIFIEGWQVGDDNSKYTFPNSATIEKYSSLIIATDSIGFQNGFGLQADIEMSMTLVNSGDYIQLLNHKNEYLDVVAYGDITAPDSSETINRPNEGQSISRKALHIDTNSAADFELVDPSPKASVPQIPLTTQTSTNSNINPSNTLTSLSDEIILPFNWIFVALFAIPIWRRKR